MSGRDDDWEPEINYSNLERYRKGSTDLSPDINQGRKITDLRDLAGLTSEELANDAGIEEKELLAIEAGFQQLTTGVAQRLADSLGVNVADLWFEDAHHGSDG